MFKHDSLFLFSRTKKSLCCLYIHHELTVERGEDRPDKSANYFVKKIWPIRILILLNQDSIYGVKIIAGLLASDERLPTTALTPKPHLQQQDLCHSE